MTELLKAYDDYGDINRAPYFTTQYHTLPSNLEFKIGLQESKKNFENVLALFDFSKFELEIVFKNWNTTDYKNTKASEDYPYEYLYKSQVKKLVIWISLNDNYLNGDFYYDANDIELEKWVLETNHKLRLSFGETKSPSFKILSSNRNGFYTKKVNTKSFKELDINQSYNNDFKEINNIISGSFQEVKSGLILLHGKPGTGKTTYIKHLISTFKNKDFIFIQNDFVAALLKPEFISFLLKHKNCVLIIEDAEKVVISRESQNSSVVSTILQLTDGLLSDHLNIKVICSFNTDLNKIDKALLRKGRMIARYEFNDLTTEKANQLLKEIGYEALNKEMSLAEIFKVRDEDFSILEKRKIGFN